MENIINDISGLMEIDSMMLSYYAMVVIKAIAVIVIGRISICVFNKIIMKIFRLYPKFNVDEKKSTTLAGILKSIVKYTVYIIMVISVLNVFDIPTAPLLATAGLGGLAIGFGAQSLVKDVFTGFFILFEDQYGVGDYVTIGGMTGTVEDIGLRITKIRSFNGDLHIIPNGEVKTVTNHSRGNSLAIIDMGVSYTADVQKAIDILKELTGEYYKAKPEAILKQPEVLGIVKLNEAEVVIRTIVQTKPLLHWEIERNLRKLILDAFKEQNIEIPYAKKIIIDKKEV
jgi:moderate conductance mechanosensitive channel